MDYAYGYKRHEKDFAHLPDIESKHIFIDHDTERLERGALVGDYLRGNAGDRIFILTPNEMGQGHFMDMIEEMGVKIVVEPIPDNAQKRGPKTKFNPGEDQLKRIKKLWHGPDTPAIILPKINDICGFEVPRHILNYQLGPRDKRKAKKK